MPGSKDGQGAGAWPLEGRDPELERFRRILHDPTVGVVIHGTAGVGKSRLAEEFLAEASTAGARTSRAKATPSTATVPLGAIRHLVDDDIDLRNPIASFAAITGRLKNASRRDSTALWVDDMHLLDSSSALLLHQLVNAGAIRLIGTVRSGEPRNNAVNALLSSTPLIRMDLDPLPLNNVHHLLDTVLGGPVGRSTVARLHHASQGNPLFLREIVSGIRRDGLLLNVEGLWEIPQDSLLRTPVLKELIRGRLAAAPARARPVLALLALCEPVGLSDAMALSDEATVFAMEEKGIIRVVGDKRRTTLELSHPLYTEAVTAELPAATRRELISGQADRITRHGARRRDDSLHIAAWRLEAEGTANPALLLQGAVLARHAHDYAMVVRLLTAVPTEELPLPGKLLLGDAYWERTEFREAEAILQSADRSAASEHEILTVTMARTMNLTWAASDVSRAIEVGNASAPRVGADARRALRVNEGANRLISGQPATGLRMVEESQVPLQDAPFPPIWLYGQAMRTIGLAVTGRSAESKAVAEELFELHSALDAQIFMPHPAINFIHLSVADQEAGALDSSRHYGQLGVTQLMEVGERMPLIWVTFQLGRAEWLAGRVRTAHRLFTEALALSSTHKNAMAAPVVRGYTAASAALCGDLGPESAEARPPAQDEPARRGYLCGEERLGDAWRAALGGRVASARQILRDAVHSARETGHVTSAMLLLTDLARLGAPREAHEQLAELLPQCDGALAPERVRFAAALTSGDPIELEQCAAALAAIGARLHAAEAAAVASAQWREGGQHRRATAAAHTAQNNLLRCEGISTPLLTRSAAVTPLTDRETQIALMVTEGMRSHDIAERLFLSKRTVTNHLQRAYKKLGVTSRDELRSQFGGV